MPSKPPPKPKAATKPKRATFERVGAPPPPSSSSSSSSSSNAEGGRGAGGGAYRADVDGLRAVAVAAVILYHLDKTWLPGGFVGVDVFFVISGYVVSGSLLRQQHATTADLLVAFYARRVKRLSPALLVMVLTASAAVSLLVTPSIARDLADYYASAAFGVVGWANNHFAARGTAYSDEGPEALEYNPFTHLWSLGVEEQFYFCFPLLVALAYGRAVVATSGPRPPHGAKPLAVLGGTWFLSLAAAAALTHVRPTWAFYTLPSRFWQLMSGAILYDCQAQRPPRATASTSFGASRSSARRATPPGRAAPWCPARRRRPTRTRATCGGRGRCTCGPFSAPRTKRGASSHRCHDTAAFVGPKRTRRVREKFYHSS